MVNMQGAPQLAASRLIDLIDARVSEIAAVFRLTHRVGFLATKASKAKSFGDSSGAATRPARLAGANPNWPGRFRAPLPGGPRGACQMAGRRAAPEWGLRLEVGHTRRPFFSAKELHRRRVRSR